MMKKILVVDDEPDIVEMIKVALESASYRVITAFNGNECLEKAKKERPDAIVLDIMMPEKDGFATCKELKGDPQTQEIPVLILTAVGEHFANSRYAKSMGLELEAEDYIDKPVNPPALLDRLAKLVK
jgi:two-component system, OmpR family, alkaline phosphatase synthesis response regulator PhoP